MKLLALDTSTELMALAVCDGARTFTRRPCGRFGRRRSVAAKFSWRERVDTWSARYAAFF